MVLPDERPHVQDVPLAGGERVQVLRAGNPVAPAVLLLHGWGGSAYNFRRVTGPLTAAGFSVVVPELRGHGGSDKPADHRLYSSGAMVAQVMAVLDQLAVRPAVVVGHSVGGAIAMDLAVARPELVPAAVLVASIGFTTLGRVNLLRRLQVWRWGHLRARPWMVRLVMRRVYGVRRRWSEEDVAAYLAPLRDPAAVAALLSLVRAFDFTPREPQSLAFLGGRLSMIFGERDRPIPYREAVAHARTFAGAQVQVLSGVGHLVPEEAPEEVVEAVMRVKG